MNLTNMPNIHKLILDKNPNPPQKILEIDNLLVTKFKNVERGMSFDIKQIILSKKRL